MNFLKLFAKNFVFTAIGMTLALIAVIVILAAIAVVGLAGEYLFGGVHGAFITLTLFTITIIAAWFSWEGEEMW